MSSLDFLPAIQTLRYNSSLPSHKLLWCSLVSLQHCMYYGPIHIVCHKRQYTNIKSQKFQCASGGGMGEPKVRKIFVQTSWTGPTFIKTLSSTVNGFTTWFFTWLAGWGLPSFSGGDGGDCCEKKNEKQHGPKSGTFDDMIHNNEEKETSTEVRKRRAKPILAARYQYLLRSFHSSEFNEFTRFSLALSLTPQEPSLCLLALFLALEGGSSCP